MATVHIPVFGNACVYVLGFGGGIDIDFFYTPFKYL